MLIWWSEIGYGTPTINAIEPTGMRRAARHRFLNIAMIRYCGSGMIGLCGGARNNKPSPIAAP
jgi:hypothetical protein